MDHVCHRTDSVCGINGYYSLRDVRGKDGNRIPRFYLAGEERCGEAVDLMHELFPGDVVSVECKSDAVVSGALIAAQE